MAADHARPIVPPKQLKTDYPVYSDPYGYSEPSALLFLAPIAPHVRRVFGYARTSDYIMGAGVSVVSPLLFGIMDRVQPAASGAINFARYRFYGLTENSREEEMDMREMVDKIKKGEPLYGTSVLSPYMQGVAARNSRYTSLFIHVIPWFNVVNHNQHGVDTAKYYRQAERELEAERVKLMRSQ
ncbi:NADH-ubiquinone oxidoreductase 21 kDa subunit [Microsporum canis CBS 113480]|uniref:NADH-ubiquinone oxidoreductase 21 kDa subunit n=1 Tax=Arthroderma otae (strain ATCC MYA-4605 / CBS 113480) TaxID=554155 RepID=C5FGV6_ARTOC|nr:NADH-ubiquinone oxidoreductase 21 kDa subunit [Microsporum canis CBS 113480]EEQ29991.1 NADH-ubiquinone oxidoreductase 21 kDa subunit [Microsporum canis CBS 113480]